MLLVLIAPPVIVMSVPSVVIVDRPANPLAPSLYWNVPLLPPDAAVTVVHDVTPLPSVVSACPEVPVPSGRVNV